jgi:hypothetical protein
VVLGRSAGLTDEEIGHLMDDPLPEGLFTPDEEAIIIYARSAAVMEPISDEVWDRLREHFSIQSIIEICFIVGMNQLTSRFHQLVLTDVDEETTAQVQGPSCRVRIPTAPVS